MNQLPQLRNWIPALLLIVAVAPGCRRPLDTGPTAPANVVLFLVDTLRADRLGIYGYDGSHAPHLDALAARGIVFQQASAPAPWTLPSVTSLLLSNLPCEHNVLIDHDRIALEAEPLAYRLKKAGYRTGAFIRNPYAGPMTGLDKGYDRCLLVRPPINGDLVAPWLASVGKDPFFLYIHNTEPHDPFLTDETFIRELGEVSREVIGRIEHSYLLYRRLTRVDHDDDQPLGTIDNAEKQDELMNRLKELEESIDLLYDAAVIQSDHYLGSVIDALKEAGAWDDTLLIVLSDHGEELGDRGGWQHDQSVYEELIRVPLILRFPHDEFAGSRFDVPVSLIDVVPTIMDYLGRPALADGCRGRSLMPLIDGESEPTTFRVMAGRHNKKKYYRPYKETRGDVNIVVRSGRWKGIWNAELDRTELYDLENDPLEQNDSSAQNQELARAMRDFAQARLAECKANAMETVTGTPSDIDEKTRQQLESLGYIHATSEERK